MSHENECVEGCGHDHSVDLEAVKVRVAELEKIGVRTIEQSEELVEQYVVWATECFEQGDPLDEILDLFGKAAKVCQATLAQGEDDEIRRRLGNIYLHRAVALNDYEEFEPAIESYAEAITILKPLEDSGDADAKYDIAGIRLNRGIIYQELGEFEQAKTDYEESFTAFRAIEKISDLDDTRFYLAKVSIAQGNLLRDMGESLDKIVDAYNRAMRLFVELIDALVDALTDPKRKESAQRQHKEYERELANTLMFRCTATYEDYMGREFDSDTDRLNKFGDVLIDVGRGIEILERLAKDGNFENRLDLFSALTMEGTMLLDLEKSQESYQIFDRAVKNFADFAEEDDPVVLNQYAGAYENRGIATMNQGNAKDALADFDKTIEIREKFLDKDFGLDEESRTIFLPTLATSFANRANAYATLGNIDKAKKDGQYGLDLIRSLKDGEIDDELAEIEQIFEALLEQWK